jgi:hypothetical protein
MFLVQKRQFLYHCNLIPFLASTLPRGCLVGSSDLNPRYNCTYIAGTVPVEESVNDERQLEDTKWLAKQVTR